MNTQQQATHSDTNPWSGQYLTHARSHITRAVALWTAVSALLSLISMARVEAGLKTLSAILTQHMWGLLAGSHVHGSSPTACAEKVDQP